ncbi:putative methyltransferase YpsC [Gottschalkia acidurici 9a]|uniref:Methyltransferase YpsC n=1 Tax=Gottschalkia acidurici (strain ATCC 7906 / DSM 604 / BCRC 14475 / CIP 104303 / KCTC 5404 / NCIMB 10678 / 9a) TaxID=1128398 RepID=K0B348_GOTA9|nr:class I SAM-dependent RNA methyltransferase [Gottschalkia acidurici]AFS79602.1 putative methyltransferase YpsC [Gottschalkia acidurici 9a]
MEYTLIATSTFGLESIVADELRSLGYDELEVENGKVTFEGDEWDLATCNVWLRTADRILIKVKEFKAESFEELFQGTKEVDWAEYIPKNGKMHVVGKSIKSKLYSVPDCQSIVKKAVVESMKREYKIDQFDEDGPTYKIEVALLKDIVTLTIDTTGPGLHKRGYRTTAGEAPLKETLASALVYLSKWNPERILADPLCGSGTILIEAAMIGRNMAPGLNRHFVAEEWEGIDKSVWTEIREYAKTKINKEKFRILGSDIDWRVLKTARDNIARANLEDYIAVQKLPVQEFSSSRKYGCIITNPPYGERLGEAREVEELYKGMGRVFSNLDAWSIFVLTSHPDFQKLYGEKSTKNRKLYNGRIQCYYYQYFGPFPPRKKKEA